MTFEFDQIMIKFNHLWYLLHICCDFAILVNPFFRAVKPREMLEEHEKRLLHYNHSLIGSFLKLLNFTALNNLYF